MIPTLNVTPALVFTDKFTAVCFANRGVLRARSRLQPDKLANKFHNRYRLRSQSSTSLFLWYFC